MFRRVLYYARLFLIGWIGGTLVRYWLQRGSYHED